MEENFSVFCLAFQFLIYFLIFVYSFNLVPSLYFVFLPHNNDCVFLVSICSVFILSHLSSVPALVLWRSVCLQTDVKVHVPVITTTVNQTAIIARETLSCGS